MIGLLTTGRHDLAYLEPIYEAIPDCRWVRVHMPLCNSATEAAGNTHRAQAQSIEQLQDLELLIVVGDRTETLAVCVAATCLKIPIAHLHGGETTLGAIDDQCRHAISQLAVLHFAANDSAAGRLRHMAVPGDIIVTGSPAIDRVLRTKRARKPGKDIVVSYHPTTKGLVGPLVEIREVVRRVENLLQEGGKAIYVGANPDAGGLMMNDYIRSRRGRWVFSPDMGPEEYWDLLSTCDVLVGNSSSGIIEAPALGVPFIEIGDRQRGRSRESYGDGHACERIAKIIADWRANSRTPLPSVCP